MTSPDGTPNTSRPVVLTAPAASPVPSAVRRRVLSVAQAGLAVVLAAVALNHLLDPYNGDLALFALMGRDLLDGRHLYTDIWDTKQPGMYLWYGVVRALLGGSEVSTRVFDVAGVLGTAWLAAQLAIQRDPRRWTRVGYAAALAAFVLIVARDELGQTEEVVALPALAAVVLARRRPGRAGLLGAGLLVGLVTVFKVPLATVTAGGLVLPTLTVTWLWATGDLDAALQTWLVYPARILAVPGARTVDRLVVGAIYFAGLTAPLWALSLWGLWSRRSGWWDELDRAMITWLVAGVAVVLAQFWWGYQWYVLLPALCVLAIRGFRDLLAGMSARARPALVAGATVVLVALPTLYVGLFGHFGVVSTAADGAFLTQAGRAHIVDRVPGRALIEAEVRTAPIAGADSLYVLGDPLYNLLAERPIALRLNASTPEFFDAGMWHELAVDLDHRRPDVVLVEAFRYNLVRERGQEFQRVLDEGYRPVRTSAAGMWYRLRTP